MEAREDPPSSLSSSPSNKKSRRSAQKRVVSVPVSDQTDGGRSKGGGEAAPPSDSWAWRKYGQKPIKGSPYPRGYYRCSSSKGCPARKQVERSRVDPSTFIVTYSSEHDHSLLGVNKRAAKCSAPAPVRDLADAGRLMMMEEGAFEWFAEVGSSASASPTGTSAELYCGPMMEIAATIFDDKFGEIGAAAEEEEDSLFAGLGELPECSVVFRRGFPAWCSGEAVAGRGGREEVRN